MNTATKRAQTLAGDALEQAVQSGVARAMASRQAAGVEMSGADIDRVSGGLALSEFMRAGGRPIDLGLVTGPELNPATNPALPAGQIAGALQNAGMVV
jgi:hypothetical protein